MYPRCTIELEQGDHVVCFHAGTLYSIERETGKTFMELAKEFTKGAEGFQMFGVGMPIILGALKSVVPDMTLELLAERIKPGKYMKTLQLVMEGLCEAIKLEGDAVAAVDAKDPPTPVAGSAS